MECPEPKFIVVKVGGSLYDLPDLRVRLSQYLARLSNHKIALFPGGGQLVEAVRQLDRQHNLGDEKSHWLAVQTLSVAANFLVGLLGSAATAVKTLSGLRTAWASRRWGVIDPVDFAHADILSVDALPCSWSVTSDSLALRLAERWGSSRLILLKSITPAPNWVEAETCDVVDPEFKRLLRSTAKRIETSIVNLRNCQRSNGCMTESG
jgi:aspartokinase-like uncharacterized kinase